MDSCQVHISEAAQKEIRQLPGNYRQRIMRTLRALEQVPRPSDSIAMDLTDMSLTLPQSMELRRIRMGEWRVVYLLEDDLRLVTVLAVRKRPPYQYDDLAALIV